MSNQLFSLGSVGMTLGAKRVMEKFGVLAIQLLARHAVGDWGNLDEEDKTYNKDALQSGARIMSAYTMSDGETKIWVITDAEDDDGNRESTTILLPEEY